MSDKHDPKKFVRLVDTRDPANGSFSAPIRPAAAKPLSVTPAASKAPPPPKPPAKKG